jgi:hypothetical protein
MVTKIFEEGPYSVCLGDEHDQTIARTIRERLPAAKAEAPPTQ